MGFLDQEFRAADLPKGTSFEPIPAGWYTATISGAEVKNTKAGTGKYINVQFSITGPSYQGRVIFASLNINNPNAKAEEIGRQQLGDLMRAIGLASLKDTDQLVGGAAEIKVALRESEQYGTQNEVKGYRAISGSAPPSVAAPATASAKPPWAK